MHLEGGAGAALCPSVPGDLMKQVWVGLTGSLLQSLPLQYL